MKILSYEQTANTAQASLFMRTQEQDVELFAGLSSEDCVQIEQIFTRNLTTGRAQRVMGRLWSQQNEMGAGAGCGLASLSASEYEQWQLCYLQRVIQVYRQEHLRLQALHQGDNMAWQTLAAQLVNGAYYLLLHMGICAAQAVEMARDAAQQTCLKIYSSIFPYDVAFNTWNHVILKNQILYPLTRSGDLLDRCRRIDSLEYMQAEIEDRRVGMAASYAANHPGPSHMLNAGQVEERDWIVRALVKISSLERRAVIVFTYFYELSDEEIAAQLGKSKGAVHTLRHRALRQLQQILSASPD